MNGLDDLNDQAAEGVAATLNEVSDGAAAGMEAASTTETVSATEPPPEGDADDDELLDDVDPVVATPEPISETKAMIHEELGHGVDGNMTDLTTELLERIALLDQRTEEHSLTLERLEHLSKTLRKAFDILSAAVTQAVERLPKKPGPKPGSKRQATKGKPGPKPKGKPGPKAKGKPGPKPAPELKKARPKR